MRKLIHGVAAVSFALATPVAAQDWLGGIARSAAQSAAQRLAERAVTGVMSGTSGTSTEAPPTRRSGGRPENYDANGDRIWRPRRTGQVYEGQAVWRSAADCAALTRLVDIHIADWQARMKRGGGEYTTSQIEGDERAAERRFREFRELGVMRLRIDHPDLDAGARFDEEMTERVTRLRQQDWAPEMTWERHRVRCGSFYDGQAGLLYDMQNGRGEGSNPAPQ